MVRQMGRTRVVKRFGMGKTWMLSWNRCGVVARVSFTDERGIRCFDQVWLRRGACIVGSKIGNVY